MDESIVKSSVQGLRKAQIQYNGLDHLLRRGQSTLVTVWSSRSVRRNTISSNTALRYGCRCPTDFHPRIAKSLPSLPSGLGMIRLASRLSKALSRLRIQSLYMLFSLPRLNVCNISATSNLATKSQSDFYSMPSMRCGSELRLVLALSRNAWFLTCLASSSLGFMTGYLHVLQHIGG